MNNDQIKQWIKDNLVMQDEARLITGQSVSAFNQSVATGKIAPFVEFGEARKTRLYLKSDLIKYALNKKGGRTLLIINYHTGVKKEVVLDSLEEAKEKAVEGMSYTQEKVTIETPDGEVLATAHWYGVQPEEDDEVLVQFGKYGFYGAWVEE